MNKEDLKNKAISLAEREGAALAARGFRAWMDRIAEKRPNGLVSRFRRFFGITRDEQKMSEVARQYIEELERERPRGKRGGP